MTNSVILEDGKYEYIIGDDGVVYCLRHGEPWLAKGKCRKSEGDLVDLVLAQRDELASAQKVLRAVRSLRANGTNGGLESAIVTREDAMWLTDAITSHDLKYLP